MAITLSTIVSATGIINNFRFALNEINRSIEWAADTKPFQELPTGILAGTTTGISRTDDIAGIARDSVIDADSLADRLIAEATEWQLIRWFNPILVVSGTGRFVPVVGFNDIKRSHFSRDWLKNTTIPTRPADFGIGFPQAGSQYLTATDPFLTGGYTVDQLLTGLIEVVAGKISSPETPVGGVFNFTRTTPWVELNNYFVNVRSASGGSTFVLGHGSTSPSNGIKIENAIRENFYIVDSSTSATSDVVTGGGQTLRKIPWGLENFLFELKEIVVNNLSKRDVISVVVAVCHSSCHNSCHSSRSRR